ncbi:sterol desaturase family protein [Clostridium fungisolvens]|uniref:Fatty acid hydroxylase domain-containing protein n=1 Tax=Clostridium fungisolvens TaxID=1604897 RepID=A0A6V8SNQ6_9CLOT|nr:sterol desaturase family protein [Clostridium fungisolvens]GFP78202.1 hypothetical protein bsdtw1_04397 [Clostridium fungisolvens]
MYGIRELSGLIILVMTIMSGLLYSSLIEYCLHRFLLHNSYEQEHVKVHHKVFHGIDSYELEVIDKETVLSSFGEILRNIVLYLPLAIAIFMKSRFLGILFLIVCIIYNLWEEFVHYYFHKKNKQLFVFKLKLFKKLKEHHRIHHYMYRYNFGIGTSLWDVIFRTIKKV